MKRRRGKAGNIIGVVLIVAVMGVLAALAGAIYLTRPPPVDATTLCRTDSGLAAHTIVLVDATDKLEPRHRRKLRAVLDQERARLAQFDRLTVMRLNVRRPQEPVILFSKCLPRPPEQINPLFENARRAKARWEESFADALGRALRSAQSGGGARSSPILAGLRAIGADPDFGPDLERRRLVLVSDLLEHDQQGFSLYVADADYSVWRAQAAFGPPDLSGVEVRVIPLDRPEQAERQAFALERFWPDYFEAAGAARAEFDPLP